MSTVPEKYPEAIAWVDTRVPIWTENAAAIGLEVAQPTNLGALATAASAAKAAYDTAKSDSDAKYEAYQAAARAMRSQATAQVGQIRSFAKGSASPSTVYSTAQIPAPADRAPTPPPGTPEAFRVSLLATGSLKFAFKCPNPSRTPSITYKVERQDTPQSPFTFLLNAKKREFEDSNFPATSTFISYRVTAQTTTQDGPAATFTVRYGAGNQSATILSQGPVVESKAS